MKNGGLRTGKRKRGVPEDMRGQEGQEGVGRDEVVTRATKGTDTKVGMMACSTAREHDEQGESEKRVVVKIFVHRWKHEQREQNRGVHRCTRTHTICNILVKLM